MLDMLMLYRDQYIHTTALQFVVFIDDATVKFRDFSGS